MKHAFTGRRRGFETPGLLGLVCEPGQARVELSAVEGHPELHEELLRLLARYGLNADMICGANVSSASSRTDIHFTLLEEEVLRLRERLELLGARLGARAVRVSGQLTKISLVGTGIRSNPALAAWLCRGLAQQDIQVAALSVDALRVSCLVDADVAEQAIHILNDAFGLAGGGAIAAITPPRAEDPSAEPLQEEAAGG